MARARIPGATYRLQFNRSFRFEHAIDLLPYLGRLGIGDVYASPIFTARRGSAHGYDVTDPGTINPELGGERGFEALAGALRDRGMGLLLDIVPNHMAASSENRWWMDLLENGGGSEFVRVFDVHWSRSGGGGAGADRIVLPVLGRPCGEALDRGELRVELLGDRLVLRYYDRLFPIAPETWGLVLAPGSGEAEAEPPPELRTLLEMASRESAGSRGTSRTSAAARAELGRLVRDGSAAAAYARRRVEGLDAKRTSGEGRRLLDSLLDRQAYELAYWRRAALDVNYRRFFDIADLVGVRVEDPYVFDITHRLALELVRDGSVTGFRIDHVDGLWDPLGYLERLREEARRASGGRELYVVVEKILSEGESLHRSWPVEGTTGYEFGTAVSKVFVSAAGLASLDAVYRDFTGEEVPFADLVHEQKKRIVGDLFLGEMAGLAEDLQTLADVLIPGPADSGEDLAAALLELTACLPIYRTYVRGESVDGRDREWLRAALAESRARSPRIGSSTWSFLERVVLMDVPAGAGEGLRRRWLDLVMRWQQMTGPVMAKGFEDTSLYRYGRLISLNQVGGEPDPEPEHLRIRAFHEFCRDRRESWPGALSASSTHDSKRGEDVRARLHVLSEIPAAWGDALRRWHRLNEGYKRTVRGNEVPSAAEESFLYQTLLGAWPLAPEEEARFADRMKDYVVKAAREAKAGTSWLRPDSEHEEALTGFLGAILDPAKSAAFLGDFHELLDRIAYPGAVNALAQLLLKVCAPGVPDTYRGTESWALTLVDPDNRRPVDFGRLRADLDGILRKADENPAAACADLLAGWRDGRVKLYVTARSHLLRKERGTLFRAGSYVALDGEGDRAGHLCAFAREHEGEWLLCVVPARIARLLGPEEPGSPVWEGTSVRLPAGAPARWREAFTGKTVRAEAGGRLSARRIFDGFPVALLTPE